MKKQLLFSFAILACSLTFAQIGSEDHEATDRKYCGHNEALEQLFSIHPEYKEEYEAEQEAFQESYEEFMENWSPDDRATYIVPVVFHVVHLGGEENISDEQVYDAIDNLNADFSETNSDLGSTITEFEGITGNADIEFRLAKKDPDGNCHKGITRTYSSTTYDTGLDFGGHPIVEAVQDEHGTWPQNSYLNIFVCIDPSGAAGYTFKPADWYPEGGMYGGIQIAHDYVGSIGTSSPVRRHTLSHEVGHWFNLSHPWGDSNSPGDPDNCTTDDGVADTPNTVGWSFCDLGGESCGSLDNVQNIMEYSYCSTMFTDGQSAKMQDAITSGTAGRDNLWQSTNLNNTGVLGPGELCEADFSYSQSIICAGGTVDFEDLSYFNVTGWEWTFDGGTPSSSTDPAPTVTYNTPGTYTVTLEVTDGTDFMTETKTGLIKVMGDPGDVVPYTEGFETITSVSDGERFFIENLNDGTEWEITSTASSLGENCVWLDNYGTDDGSVDNLISAPIDLSPIDASDDVILSFDCAYKKRTSSTDESFKFYISKDCGESWALRKNYDSDDLSSGTESGAYTPEGQDEWKTEEIDNITNTYWVSNFMYKFEFTNNDGNNIYLDNINLWAASMVDLLENSKDSGVRLYPNPTTGNTTVELNIVTEGDYKIDLYSTLGSKLQSIYSGPLKSGREKIEFSTETLPKGVYIVRVEGQGSINAVRLIKK